MKRLSICSILLFLFMQVTFLHPAAALAEEEPLFGFSVLSDIHVQSWDTQSHSKLKTALADLHETAPDASALILNGDLGNGTPDDYQKLKGLLKQLPHPPALYASIGNHEFYKAWTTPSGKWSPESFPNGETEAASIQRFLQFTGESSIYHEKIIQGHHFLFLGSEQYRQTNPGNEEDAYLSAAQLDWLRQRLNHTQNSSAADRSKPIFVFLHQPLSETVAGSECCVYNRAVLQDKELRSLLSGYPQTILFSSHSHLNLRLPRTMVQDRFTMVNTSSVEEPWTVDSNGGYLSLAANASEGLYVEVYKEKVLIKGRDFTNHSWIPEAQFTVVPPAANKQSR
ncbi:MAG: phosphohydrolase [Paenibacillus sp.]|jgi:predicted MPP superfamily phosphohydrolase|nr:phosphohydrolase [Paenibacillus sp.]